MLWMGPADYSSVYKWCTFQKRCFKSFYPSFFFLLGCIFFHVSWVLPVIGWAVTGCRPLAVGQAVQTGSVNAKQIRETPDLTALWSYELSCLREAFRGVKSRPLNGKRNCEVFLHRGANGNHLTEYFLSPFQDGPSRSCPTKPQSCIRILSVVNGNAGPVHWQLLPNLSGIVTVVMMAKVTLALCKLVGYLTFQFKVFSSRTSYSSTTSNYLKATELGEDLSWSYNRLHMTKAC